MTRKEQIKEVAQKEMSKYPNFCITAPAFRMGAEWADEHPHWISVEDELPKDWEEQLFALYTEPLNEDYSYMGRYRIGEYDGDKTKYYLIANNRWKIHGKKDDNTRVTHWMPLPQAPSSSEIPNNSKKGGNYD